MSKKNSKDSIRKAAWKLQQKIIFQLLSTRCRREHLPECGYFRPKDIERIISRAEENIQELMPFFVDINHLGNYRWEYLGLLDLAIYRALISEHVEGNYAISLVADSIWLSVLHLEGSISMSIGKFFLRLFSKNPTNYLEKVLKWVVKSRAGPPGYMVNFFKENNVFHLNYSSCLVHNFYKQFGKEEMHLFRRTWCTGDFATAELLVDGGKYEREHTLSDGDEVCDMRWFVKK